MPFRRRGNSLRPINSQKHENTWSFLGQDAATATQQVLIATATDRGTIDTSNPDEVAIGSKLKGLYMEFHFSPAQTGNANVIHWKVVHKKGTQVNSAPNVYNQDDKSTILKRGMEMLVTNVATVYKRIITVPIRDTMRQGDVIKFLYQASSTQTINTCGIIIFREYT